MRIPVQSTSLLNGDRVVIVVGGPAGSFFAIHLLREAKRLDRNIKVVIVEKRGSSDLKLRRLSMQGMQLLRRPYLPEVE